MTTDGPTTKTFSISLGSSKSTSTSTSNKPGFKLGQALKPTSGVKSSPNSSQNSIKPSLKRPASALLNNDDSDPDEAPPAHESVSGFSAEGAIITSKNTAERASKVLVIARQANRDWRAESRRKRGGVLPREVQAQRSGAADREPEKSEVSKAFGLTFVSSAADVPQTACTATRENGTSSATETTTYAPPTIEEQALAALTNDDNTKATTRTTTIILQPPSSSDTTQYGTQMEGLPSDAAAFKADVQSRPDVPSLSDYAAIPVEDFGAALLRGMGWKEGEAVGKRRGTTAVASSTTKPRVVERRAALLGIGAKEMPTQSELAGQKVGSRVVPGKKAAGRWTDPKVYSPVMLRNRETGEMVTEEELKAKIRAQEQAEKAKEDQNADEWKERRRRNLEGGATGERDIRSDQGSQMAAERGLSIEIETGTETGIETEIVIEIETGTKTETETETETETGTGIETETGTGTGTTTAARAGARTPLHRLQSRSRQTPETPDKKAAAEMVTEMETETAITIATATATATATASPHEHETKVMVEKATKAGLETGRTANMARLDEKQDATHHLIDDSVVLCG